MKIKDILNVNLEDNHLRVHTQLHIKNIHDSQKDFISSYCGKSFTQAVNLMKTIDEDQRYLKQQLMAMHWRHSEYVGPSSSSNGYTFRIIQGFSW